MTSEHALDVLELLSSDSWKAVGDGDKVPLISMYRERRDAISKAIIILKKHIAENDAAAFANRRLRS